MKDPQIFDRLKTLDKRWRAILLVTGAGRSGLYFLLGVVVFCMADWLLQLPFFCRVPLAVALYGGVVVHAWKTWLRAWLKPFSAVDAAWRVEDQCPELGEELISAVDFSSDDNGSHGSESLVQEVLKHAKLDVQNLPVASTFPINWRQLRWPIGLAVLMLAALAVPSLNFRQSLSRALVPGAGDATVGPVILEVVSPGDGLVVENAAVRFAATRTGEELDDLELVLQGQSVRFIPLVYDFEQQQYAASVDGLHESVTYWVRSGRMRSKSHHLKVVPLPRIQDFSIKYTYPAYTGQPPKSETTTTGDVKAIEGTRITLVSNVNKPIKEAILTIAAIEGGSGAKVAMEQIQGHPRRGQFSFTISNTTTFQLNLTDIDDLSPELSPSYQIIALPDHPPTIELIVPDKDLAAKPNETVALEWIAEDDFGIAAQQLLVQINERDLPPQRLAADSEVATLQLKDLPLVPGDVVKVSIHGRDHATKSTISDVRRITILNHSETDNRPAVFFEAAANLRQTLIELASSQEQLNLMANKLTSITNLESIDRRHYHARFSEQLENVNDLMEITLFHLAEVKKNGFFPRAKGYTGLMERYVKQEQFAHIVGLRSNPEVDAVEALGFVSTLNLALLNAMIEKGREVSALQVTTHAAVDAKALAGQLPDSSARLKNVTTRITDLLAHLPMALKATLPQVQPDKKAPIAIKQVRTKLTAAARDYTKQQLAAAAIKERLKPEAKALADAADRAAVHKDSLAKKNLEEMAAFLKEKAKTNDTPQERLDAAIQANAIKEKLKEDRPQDLAKTAEAIAELNDSKAAQDAMKEIQELVQKTKDTTDDAQASFEKTPDNKHALEAKIEEAKSLAEHVEAIAELNQDKAMNQLSKRAQFVKDHLEKALEAIEKGDKNKTKSELQTAVNDAKNLAKELERVQQKSEETERLARKNIEADGPSKADQVRDAAEQISNSAPPNGLPKDKNEADEKLAAVQQQLQDEAELSAGKHNDLGGAAEKDALAAAVERAREDAGREPPKQTADNLQNLADLLDKHEAIASRTTSHNEAKELHDEILSKTGAAPDGENREQLRQTALERAQVKAEAFAQEAQQAQTPETAADLAQKTADLEDDLRNLTLDAPPEPAQANQNGAKTAKRPDFDNALEDLSQAKHALSEAETRAQRAEEKQESFAQQQRDGQRMLEDALEKRLPENTKRDLTRLAEEFQKHQADPNRQADLLNQAGDRLGEVSAETKDALKEQAKTLKEGAQAAQVARDDLNRVKDLSREAAQKAAQAERQIAKLDESANDWHEAVREQLEDNLANGQLEEARKNVDALEQTALDSIAAGSQQEMPQEPTVAAEQALESALSKATAENKPALEESLQALRDGDLEKAQALAESVASQKAPEAALAAEARKLAQTGDPVEALRRAEEKARQNRMGQAAAHAEAAGNPEELADQLAAAEEAIENAVDEANKAAAETNDRGLEGVLRAAANAARHNNLEEASQHLKRTGEDGQAALEALTDAQAKSEAAQQAAKEAYETAKAAAPIEAARQAAATAAAEIRAEAAQLKEQAAQLSKTEPQQAAALRKEAQTAEQRARALQQAGQQLSSQNPSQAATKAEQLAGASLAAAEAAEQLSQAMAGEQTASQSPSAQAPSTPGGDTPPPAGQPATPGEAPAPAGQPSQASQAPPSGQPSSPAAPSQQSQLANAQIATAADHLAQAQEALQQAASTPAAAESSAGAERPAGPESASPAPPSASQSLSEAAQALAQAAAQSGPASPSAEAPPAPGEQPGESGPASGESESQGEGAQEASTIGSSADAAATAKHTWSKLWKGSQSELAGEASKGQINQYGDFYRKANQRYLARLAAETRRREAANRNR